MGFNNTTTSVNLVAKLTPLGRQRLVSTNNALITSFSLGDSDANYNASLPLNSGEVPSLCGNIGPINTSGNSVTTNVNLRTAFVETLTTTLPTTQASYAYTESVPKDGNFNFVAEGTAKPQVDFKFETRYASPVKCAGYIVLTEESVQDIPNLQSIASDYLRKKHDLKRQNGILFGDGISENPKGATLYGRTFVVGAMAGAITSPNFMDVVNAVITDIYSTHNYTDEMPYMANLVLVNPMDFFTQIVGAKDGFGRQLFPMASLMNKVTIGGVDIIPHYEIPVGKIFVADMSKYNTTNYIGYTIRIGWINDQMITNQFTMVGESRFHAFVKKLDEQAFVYDDIATIKEAIDEVAVV